MKNIKFQYSMTKTKNRFRILKLGTPRRVGSPSEARTILVIVICPSTRLRVVSLSNHLIFVICDLEFLIL